MVLTASHSGFSIIRFAMVVAGVALALIWDSRPPPPVYAPYMPHICGHLVVVRGAGLDRAGIARGEDAVRRAVVLATCEAGRDFRSR